MTNGQCVLLQYSEDVKALAESYGFKAVGPHHGAYLIQEPNGAAWLFGSNLGTYGRVVLESVWTPLNVAVMNGESTEGL